MTIRYNLSSVGTCLAIPLYGAIVCGLAVGSDYLPAFTAAALLALSVKNFARSFCNGYGFDAIFRASLYLGLLPFVSTAALPLLLILPPAVLLFRRTLREAVVAIAGVLLPAFTICYINWGAGGEFLAPLMALGDPFITGKPFALLSAVPLRNLVLLGGIFVLDLLALLFFLSDIYAVGTKSRTILIYNISVLVLTAAVLTGSILLKLWMALFDRKLGRKISSAALIAAAADSRSDVIATGAVLLACVIGRLTGLMIDGWAGLLVALFILWSGVGVVKDTVDPLLGAKPDEALVRAIAYLMTSHVDILGFHDLMVHDYGPGRRFASVHAEIDHRIDPLIAHEILDEIERQAKKDLHVDLVIHYDPIVTDDPEVCAVRTRVLSILHAIDPRLSFHDFRMVSGPHHVNVIFDMVIPPEYADRTEQLRKQVEAQLQDGKKAYHLVVTFDTAAFNALSTEAGE